MHACLAAAVEPGLGSGRALRERRADPVARERQPEALRLARQLHQRIRCICMRKNASTFIPAAPHMY